jgi:hypothetical protein
MKNSLFLSFFLVVLMPESILVPGFESMPCDNDYGSASSIYNIPSGNDYSCHQYVKAALLNNWVNLATGKPISNEDQFEGLSITEIAEDPNFIQVSVDDAQAVTPLHGGYNNAYHSALKLSGGTFASAPSSTYHIYQTPNPRWYTNACPGEEEYYAAIPYITITGYSAVNQGMNITLTLTNNGQSFPSFLQLDTDKWDYDPAHFTKVSSTGTSITLTAKYVAVTSEVKYVLYTGNNASDTTKANGRRIKLVQIMPDCSGTLNGGPLNTFNTVPAGTNQIIMVQSSWTWVKTSGNATWSTSNGGKNMSFSISSGCATFNAYNASCNRTMTFCKGSSLIAYSVIDMKTLKVIKEGTTEDIEETNTLLDGLPEGTYVVTVDGNRTRYVKSN